MSEDQAEYVITDKVDVETVTKVRNIILLFLEGMDWEWFRSVLAEVGMTREEFEKFMAGGE